MVVGPGESPLASCSMPRKGAPRGALCANPPETLQVVDNGSERLNKEHGAACQQGSAMQATASEDPWVKLKVCLAGEVAVGKTSLIRRYVDDTFDDRYLATMGAKVTKRVLSVTMPGSRQRGHVDLTIWDIMGDRGFRDLLKEAYFQGVQGILAVCDVTRPETLLELEDWRRAIEKVAGRIPAYVLANKVDLVEETRLTSSDLETFCKEWDCPYLLTSAKTGENVEEAFEGLISLVLEAQLRRQAVPA